MRLAIIDLGTNSVRFDVHQIRPNGRVERLHREKIMVRLGQNAFLRGRLDPNAARRTLHAFLKFKGIAQEMRVHKVIAFGTSALREVSDQDVFVKNIRSRTGIDIRVIPGAEEASLIATGILSNEKLPKGRFALVDIGGGSTEISICQSRKILHSESFPLGTARLQQMFLKGSPPEPRSVTGLRQFIEQTLRQKMEKEEWPGVTHIVGSSGTVRALERVLKEHEGAAGITRASLKKLVQKIAGMTRSQLLKIRGLEPKRVEMFLAGSILFEECMKALGAKTASATEYSLRDGILEEEKQLMIEGETSHLALHLDDIFRKARAFSLNAAHVERVAAMTDRLYKSLDSLHRLEPHWEIFLTAAAVLRKCGETVSLPRYCEHSYYIVRNSDLPAEPAELEFIAQLCLHSGSSKTEMKGVPFEKNRRKMSAFLRLLALLRVVDALDSGPGTKIAIRKVQITSKNVRIVTNGRNLTGLEAIHLESRSGLFQKVFRRSVSLG